MKKGFYSVIHEKNKTGAALPETIDGDSLSELIDDFEPVRRGMSRHTFLATKARLEKVEAKLRDKAPVERKLRFRKGNNGNCQVIGCDATLLPDRFGHTVTIFHRGRNCRICASHLKEEQSK
jgi:hypothetical protein